MNNFLRILWYGIQAFRRNIWLSAIAIITMTMTLLTISVFAVGDIVIRERYQDFNKNIDYVVFIKDAASDADVSLFMIQVKNQPEVATVTLKNKEDVRKDFEQTFNKFSDLKDIVTADNNPLLREVTVKFSDPRSIGTFNTFVNQQKFQPIINTTSYSDNQASIDNYVRLTGFLRLIGLGMMAFFLFISVLVILNTIRLTIYSRKTEIEVMRLVGATASYIRGPFIVEGILYGMLSALLGSLVAWGLLTQLQVIVSQSFGLGQGSVLTAIFGTTLGATGATIVDLLTYVFTLQICVGIVLGVSCSIIAVRRYLKE